MANLKNDPQVQALLAKAAEQAEKQAAKAIKAETKRILDAVKAVEVSDDRDMARTESRFRKLVIGAIKGE